MQEFKDIQTLWKQTENREVSAPKIDFRKIKSNKQILKKKQIFTAVTLLLTVVFLLSLMIFLDENVKSIYIISSIIVIEIICFLQSLLHFYNVKKINEINETQTPEKVLKQWQNYQELQKKQRHWNMPIYYFLLGTALAVYMLDILKNSELWKIILMFVATYAWLLFAYFYLGKKELKKQDAKIDSIIYELKNLENQFS